MMPKPNYSQSEEADIQKAIVFLTRNFEKTGHNLKPVVLHSLRVAFYLMQQQQLVNTVVVAVLHDLIEDTDVTETEIEQEFGTDVAHTVSALSFKSEITDPTSQYKELFDRCLRAGQAALIIKAADLLDNSGYYEQAAAKLQPVLWEKLSYYLKLTQATIGNTQVWKDLDQRNCSKNIRTVFPVRLAQ